MTVTRRSLGMAGLAAASLPLAAPAVLAQGAWPSRTVRVVVPWPPGATAE
jgi:tripartite-type tricarboxylate transporter receptor subunit TctC